MELPINPLQREILVIDAAERARALMRQLLAEQGFAVTAVGDGSAALRRIEAQPFALVITKIRLPGPLDGLTTIRQARARQPGLKCLFTSGFAPAPLWNNAELEISSPSRFTDGTSWVAYSSCCSATQLSAVLSPRISNTVTHRPVRAPVIAGSTVGTRPRSGCAVSRSD